jgi:hypothetical protein
VTHVLCSAADSRGNAASAAFDVTVRDTTAPSLLVPADIIAEATSPSGAAVSYAASATDLVDGPVAVNCTPAPGGTFALGTTTVTCTASDANHNTGARGFSVTVRDTTAPALSAPGNITVNATGPAGALVTYVANATDVADPAPRVGCVPASGSLFPVGTSSVTCTARDNSGNSTSAAFLVTVKGAGDQLTDLINLVNGLGLPHGSTNSLVTKLEHARDAFAAGKTNPACQTLSAFVNEVEAKRGRQLTNAQADQFVDDAERIGAVMGCS